MSLCPHTDSLLETVNTKACYPTFKFCMCKGHTSSTSKWNGSIWGWIQFSRKNDPRSYELLLGEKVPHPTAHVPPCSVQGPCPPPSGISWMFPSSRLLWIVSSLTLSHTPCRGVSLVGSTCPSSEGEASSPARPRQEVSKRVQSELEGLLRARWFYLTKTTRGWGRGRS